MTEATELADEHGIEFRWSGPDGGDYGFGGRYVPAGKNWNDSGCSDDSDWDDSGCSEGTTEGEWISSTQDC